LRRPIPSWLFRDESANSRYDCGLDASCLGHDLLSVHQAMTNRYIVGYRDSPKSRTLYFGPYASESVADFFVAALPTPLPGGWVRTVPLQPFMAHEARTVAQLIERHREDNPIRGRQFA
jgi:hypothetical protein